MKVKQGVLSPLKRMSGLWSGIIAIIIGAGPLFLGWQWRSYTQAMIAAMLPAEGRVAQLIPLTDHKGKAMFYPIVEFRTAEGQTIRFQGSTGSNPPTYRVGEKVQVRYDPQSPESAVIDSWDLWLPSTILIGAGGFFVLLGFLFVLDALAALLQLGGLLGLLGLILLRQKRQ
jgi:hypothetical protein